MGARASWEGAEAGHRNEPVKCADAPHAVRSPSSSDQSAYYYPGSKAAGLSLLHFCEVDANAPLS